MGRHWRRIWDSRGEWSYGLCLAVCLLLIGGAAFFVRSGHRTPTPAPADWQIVPISMEGHTVETLGEALERTMPEPVWPLSGRVILTPHSDSVPQYSKTLDLWALHEGIDIAAAPGEAVLSAFDGEVCGLRKDALLGYVIELRSTGGMLARYGNLTSLNKVWAGERVAAGQAIGSVGHSAEGETLMAPHLHYALYGPDGSWALDGEEMALKAAQYGTN